MIRKVFKQPYMYIIGYVKHTLKGMVDANYGEGNSKLSYIKAESLKFSKTNKFGILGQVWCLIVSIPDLCPLSYFYVK